MIKQETVRVLGLRSVLPTDECGWEDQTVPGGPIVLHNPQIGTWVYGYDDEVGYDRWLFYEINGGGVRCIPYAWVDGKLYVVLLRANRNNVKSDSDCYEAIGGFFNKEGELTLRAGVREIIQEAGLYAEIVEVVGRLPVNNRATSYTPSEDKGMHTVRLEINSNVMESIRRNNDLWMLPYDEGVMVSRDDVTRSALATVHAEIATSSPKAIVV